MRNAVFLIALICLVSFQIQAQDVVLEKNVEDQYQRDKGPNTAFFGQGYVGFASILNFD